MFLSKLTPNLYHRDVRYNLANPYDLHRTLLQAFPDTGAGGPGRVLFRVELSRDEGPTILVQSEKEPAWSRLPASYLADWQMKSLDGLTFRPGQRLRFRLRANPTKRAGKSARDSRWIGKRVGLCAEDDQRNWLDRKGQTGGFRVGREDCFLIPEAQVVAHKAGQTMRFQSIRFEGVLEVMDPNEFHRTLAEGVGSAKGLGFGLLSLGGPSLVSSSPHRWG